MTAKVLQVCPRCGRPIPDFTDAAHRHQWERGHEEGCHE